MTTPSLTAEEIAGRMSKAQKETFLDGRNCVRSYRPAKKLVEFGLWRELDPDDPHLIRPVETDLGLEVRAILERNSTHA